MAQRDQSVEAAARRPSFSPAGILLGIGLGGFIDGILLHQILQWHHMISHDEPVDTVLGLERNTLWDGLFHAFTWVAVLVGLVLFARQVDRAARPIVTSSAHTQNGRNGEQIALMELFNVHRDIQEPC